MPAGAADMTGGGCNQDHMLAESSWINFVHQFSGLQDEWQQRAYIFSCSSAACCHKLLKGGFPSSWGSLPHCAGSPLYHPLVFGLRSSSNLLAGSTGCHGWEASFLLAETILNYANKFAGKPLALSAAPHYHSTCRLETSSSSLLSSEREAAGMVTACRIMARAVPFTPCSDAWSQCRGSC